MEQIISRVLNTYKQFPENSIIFKTDSSIIEKARDVQSYLESQLQLTEKELYNK